MHTCTPTQTKYRGSTQYLSRPRPLNTLLNKHLHRRQRGMNSSSVLTHLPQSTTQHQTAACIILPSLHQQSTHLSSTCPSIRPLPLSFFFLIFFLPSSSVPSVGPVQSESLVELRLSRLISKSCLFHLSKCLHSQLLYEEADKGGLLSTADSPPQPNVGAAVYLYACTAYAKLCVRDLCVCAFIYVYTYVHIYETSLKFFVCI